MDILVTNNPLVQSQEQTKFRIDYLDTDLLGVLTYVRDMIHRGHSLLTHPLSGSVKPNESPYKSILLTGLQAKSDLQTNSKMQYETDFSSVEIIENCILTAQKFPQRSFPEQHLHDMQTIDLTLIQTALMV